MRHANPGAGSDYCGRVGPRHAAGMAAGDFDAASHPDWLCAIRILVDPPDRLRMRMVLPVRIELTTSALPRMRSTTELRQQLEEVRAYGVSLAPLSTRPFDFAQDKLSPAD